MFSTQEFLDAVVPAGPFRFLMALMPDKRPVHRDFAAHETPDLLGFAQWACRSKGADVYIAIAGYEPVDGALNRSARCARWHRSLRVDIDCGPGKPYADQRAGLQALGAFLLPLQLPRPWVVDSGHGLHVYWGFDRDISLEEWKPLAEALKARAAAAGFNLDPTGTADAARVLRLPGTLNFKTDPREVRILAAGSPTSPAALAAILGPAPAASHLALGPVPMSLLGSSTGELGAGQYPPYTLRGVLTGCPGMRETLRAGGAMATEPLWKVMLDLVHRADEPEPVKLRVAHALSKGHVGYTPEGLEAKWNQTQRQNYQPPTCATLASLGLAECATCPLRATIKSPVVLGRAEPLTAPDTAAIPMPAAPPPPALMQLPAAPALGQPTVQGVFLLDPASPTVTIVDGPLTHNLCVKDGIPHMKAQIVEAGVEGAPPQTKSVWKRIGSYRLVAAERLLDRMGRQSITAITFDRNSDGYVTVEATNADMSDGRSFNKLMIAHGLYMGSNDIKAMQDKFMPEFLAQFQRVRAANQIAARCGWTEDRSGFVLGTTLYTARGAEHVRPSGAMDEMEAYHTAGDESVWRTAFDITLAGGPDRQAVLALAIAAPLMIYTGVDGVMLNAYSPESGVGKSTLCDAVLSIWGSPNKLRKDYRDTANATFKLAAVVGNLPMVVDEFTNVEGKQLSDYVYTITQGREKHRLTSDSKLNSNANRWCLPAIVTSNNSVHDKLQSFRGDAVAEAARVFELRLRPLVVPLEVMGQRKIELLALRSNYGFLGPRLVNLFLQRTPEQWQRTVADRVAWWDKEVASDTSDRFRSACAALVDIGAAIGSALGFNFDRKAILDVIQHQWKQQQEEFEAARRQPIDFVNEFIVDNLADFAVIGGANSDALMTQSRRFRGEIRGRSISGRFVPDRVIIPMNTFRDYVRDKNGNYKTIVEWLRAETRPDGIVNRVGTMVFLEGTVQQIRTQAINLNAAVLGSATVRVVGGQLTPPPYEAGGGQG